MVAGVVIYRGCRIKWNLTCIFVYPGVWQGSATVVYPADSAGTLTTAEPIPDSAEFLASEDKVRESVLKKAREWIDREL